MNIDDTLVRTDRVPSGTGLEGDGMRCRTLGFAWTLAVAGINCGCATIGAGQPVHSDVPVASGEQERPSGETVDVEQSGTSLSLRARKLCAVDETREVTRTTAIPRENKSAWVDWTLGVGGAAIAGAGAVTLVDAGKVSSTDQSSRTYNPVGGTGAVLLGASLIALGAAGATVALVDIVRASGSDESKARVNLPGKELRRGVACKTPAPVEGVELAIGLPRGRGEKDDRIALGKTGSEGTLRVDLERVLPADLGSGNKAPVVRDAMEVGTVDLAPVYAAREASAWNQLDKAACAEPKRANACAPIKAFIKEYPASAHVTEARMIVAKAWPTIEALEERETWEGVNVEAPSGVSYAATSSRLAACAAGCAA